MKTYIFDASILGCLLFNENVKIVKKIKTIIINASVKKAKICAPTLLPYEISNIIKNRVGKDQSQNLFRDFANLPIELVNITSEQMAKILEMAGDYDVTTYDASYHYLGKFLDGTFITCDQKYFQKAKKLGGIELIS